MKLRLGLELGDQPVDPILVEQLLRGMPEMDFIIGSVHMLSPKFDSQDLAWIQEPDEKTCYAELEDYLETMLQMARWGKFTVLGHMTLPLRYMNDKRGFGVSKMCIRDSPKAFEGFPIALVTAGLMALAFMGFSGANVFG